MTLLVNVLLLILLLVALSIIWGYLNDVFPAPPSAKKAKLIDKRKGIDNIGVSVSFFCHDGNGSFVMAKRSQKTRDEQGRWDTGGGSIEFGENIEDALHREIKEEYLTDVVKVEFLGYRDVHRKLPNGTPTHWICIDYKAQVNRDQVGIGEPDSIDELMWVTEGKMPEPIHSQLQPFLDKYKSKLFV